MTKAYTTRYGTREAHTPVWVSQYCYKLYTLSVIIYKHMGDRRPVPRGGDTMSPKVSAGPLGG